MGCFPSFAATTLFCLASWQSANGEETPTNTLVVELVKAVKSSDYPEDEYQALFKAVIEGAVDSEDLTQGDDSSIALQSAWDSIGPFQTEGASRWLQSSPLERCQFIGFIEGRTRVRAPRWWRDMVLWGPFDGPNPDRAVAHADAIAEKADIRRPPTGDYLLLATHEGEIRLEASVLQSSLEDVILERTARAAVTEKHCFLALHDDVGYPHAVSCFDRKTGKAVWAAEAVGCWMGGASGGHKSWVSLQVCSDQIVVFGAAYTGFYAQAFSIADGKTAWRFSTIFASSLSD